MLTDATYNAFAMGLVGHVSRRALGSDEASVRIVGKRPADHILAGFLTPQRALEDVVHGEDVTDTSDLPKDSAYEQSAIGMEWLLNLDAVHGEHLTVEATLSIYVRRVPPFADQERAARWSVPRKAGQIEEAPLVPVWTREDVPTVKVSIDLSNLVAHGKVIVSLDGAMKMAMGERLRGQQDLYPVLEQLEVPKHLFTPEGYVAWAYRAPSSTMSTALAWCPIIDIRLVPVPTESGCARLCLRIINKTPQRKRAYEVEFVDPNLYAVDLQVVCPARIHQPTTFAELPRSYRYDRTIPAVGINCDVEAHQDQDVLSLRTRSIPRKVVPRLEPRELRVGMTPTFIALAHNPLPLLRGILDEMRRYDATTWAAKIATLSGG